MSGDTIKTGPLSFTWSNGRLIVSTPDHSYPIYGEEAYNLLSFLFDRQQAIYEAAHQQPGRPREEKTQGRGVRFVEVREGQEEE